MIISHSQLELEVNETKFHLHYLLDTSKPRSFVVRQASVSRKPNLLGSKEDSVREAVRMYSTSQATFRRRPCQLYISR